MGRTKKAKAIKVKMDPERARRLRLIGLHAMLALVLIGGGGAGYYYADSYVEEKVAFTSQPLIIVLKNRPPWMNDFLVEQIASIARPIGAHSAFDHKLLVDTVEMLSRNPWVRQVRYVRRAYTHRPGDTLEIDCEYRAPVALVKWGPFYWLVDENRVRLSERFTDQDVPNIQFGPDGKTRIRVIEGVGNAVPHVAGDPWKGADLAAGLKMVKYLFGLPYTEQVLRVDVSNFGGRVDPKNPQIVLGTTFNTQIGWGRPPADDDVDSFIEVSTAQKLKYLQTAFKQFGRVDGKHKWLDIRFDKVTYPSEEDPATATPPPPTTSRNHRSTANHR